MNYINIPDFIKKHLRFKQHWNRKMIDMHNSQWQILEEDTFLGNCAYAKGSRFKVFETANFGWIAFAADTKTPDGNTPGQRIWKW